MARKEPQFDLNRVSWMSEKYPSDRRIKEVIIKKEAALFEEKVRRDLCAFQASKIIKI